MPRLARVKSYSGYYHIIMRGINRQELFKDDQDYRKFLRFLKRCKDIVEIEVLGWCLMNNHVHMLIKEGNEDISITIKRIGISYVWYHHVKYNCVGHLFQDRFHSETVEDDQYLLTVTRYIHQNPVKAKLVDRPSDWQWSSCLGYYGKEVYPASLLAPHLIYEVVHPGDQEKGLQMFKAFNEAENEDHCLDCIDKKRYTNEEVKEIIYELFPEIGHKEFEALPRCMQKKILQKISTIKGITQKQTAAVFGLSQGYISKLKKYK